VSDNKFEMVKQSPLCVEFDEDECRALAGIVDCRKLGHGDILIEEGHTDHTLYIIVSGALEVSRSVGGGEHVSLHIHKAGDVAGALGFIDGCEHSATLRAIGPVEVFSLEREAFEGLIDDHPRLVYKVMRALSRSVHQITSRMNAQYVELSNYISKVHGRY